MARFNPANLDFSSIGEAINRKHEHSQQYWDRNLGYLDKIGNSASNLYDDYKRSSIRDEIAKMNEAVAKRNAMSDKINEQDARIDDFLDTADDELDALEMASANGNRNVENPFNIADIESNLGSEYNFATDNGEPEYLVVPDAPSYGEIMAKALELKQLGDSSAYDLLMDEQTRNEKEFQRNFQEAQFKWQKDQAGKQLEFQKEQARIQNEIAAAEKIAEANEKEYQGNLKKFKYDLNTRMNEVAGQLSKEKKTADQKADAMSIEIENAHNDLLNAGMREEDFWAEMNAWSEMKEWAKLFGEAKVPIKPQQKQVVPTFNRKE